MKKALYIGPRPIALAHIPIGAWLEGFADGWWLVWVDLP